jgi:hypothetical protein
MEETTAQSTEAYTTTQETPWLKANLEHINALADQIPLLTQQFFQGTVNLSQIEDLRDAIKANVARVLGQGGHTPPPPPKP